MINNETTAAQFSGAIGWCALAILDCRRMTPPPEMNAEHSQLKASRELEDEVTSVIMRPCSVSTSVSGSTPLCRRTT